MSHIFDKSIELVDKLEEFQAKYPQAKEIPYELGMEIISFLNEIPLTPVDLDSVSGYISNSLEKVEKGGLTIEHVIERLEYYSDRFCAERVLMMYIYIRLIMKES